MTSRIIRESALTSYSLDQLSDGAERLWWRLTAVADDHGRFNADPRVLCAMCFPIKAVGMDPARIDAWLDELVAIDGVRRYDVDGHAYGYFVNWTKYQRPPRYKAKWPPPPNSRHEPPSADGSGYNPPHSGFQRLGEVSTSNDNEKLGSRHEPPSAAIGGQPSAFILTPDQKASQAKAGLRPYAEILADMQAEAGLPSAIRQRTSLSEMFREQVESHQADEAKEE
jgi:hypothetical protein